MTDYNGLPVAVDVVGGDNYLCGMAVRGAIAAQNEFGIPVILVGDRDFIALHTTDPSIATAHAGRVIEMNAKGLALGRAGSSMRVGFDLINGGDSKALVSAGNSAGMVVNTSIALRQPNTQRAGY